MTQADVLVISTIAGNASLCLLLLWRGWAGRLGWFTFMTGLAVLVEAAGQYIHGFYHHMYGPLRILLIYWLFNVLLALCIFEAYRVRVKWLEWLLSIQLLVSIVALFEHQHGDPIGVYYSEMVNCWLNIGGIALCLYRFRGEASYNRH